MEESHDLPSQEPSQEPSQDPIAESTATDSLRPDEGRQEILEIANLLESVQRETAKVLIGQESLIEQMLIALLTRGNVLLEGVPGIAKTLAARSLSRCITSEFTRIQFTPDLMPADILGSTIFNMKESVFEFRKGPIFSNIILIDEVNRAPAKTQAALIEVMEERQVTIEGVTHEMDSPFFIIATQNPVEQEGTYKLPEAQMDRFLFRIRLGYPGIEDERAILNRYQSDFESRTVDDVNAVISTEQLARAQAITEEVKIQNGLINYIAEIVVATRDNADLYLGASPRASLSIMKASKAMALIRGRNFVTPDDIQAVAYPVLDHRIILSHEREMEGFTPPDIIKSIIDKIEVPR